MKKQFTPIVLLVLVFAGVLCVACGDPDLKPNQNGTNGNNNQNVENPSTDITNKVNNNVSANVSYKDYGWQINITSNLSKVFPNKAISYGIECGYNGYDAQKYFNFSGSTFTTLEPLFIDYYAEYVVTYRYWLSWLELKDKSSLRSDERDLLNACVKEMRAKEPTAKSSYKGRLFTKIDNERYYFFYF